MPLLHTLHISLCGKLKELPDRLRFITALKNLSVNCLSIRLGGFPQLQKLEFFGLMQWEEWIVEEGSMPLLHSLEIYYCPKLKEIPDGLRFITSLKSLFCCDMAKGWKKRLSKGGKDYYKVQYIPSVTIL
ncbi:unnamed protein product [Brassica oleracea var. botrytis]